MIIFLIPCVCFVDAFFIEPKWLKVKRIKLNKSNPGLRLIHISDIHYRGDRKYLERTVKIINEQQPDFVCFTGDIIEDNKYLSEALDILSGLQSPLYGVPGNHEYWSGTSFDEISKCFESTGGAWLVDSVKEIKDKNVFIFRVDEEGVDVTEKAESSKRIMLTHYPDFANRGGRSSI